MPVPLVRSDFGDASRLQYNEMVICLVAKYRTGGLRFYVALIGTITRGLVVANLLSSCVQGGTVTGTLT